jgi:hypothetical protein
LTYSQGIVNLCPMPTLERVEEAIFYLEGFYVSFKRKSRTTGRLRDARSDMKRLPPYDYDNKFQGDRKVSEWIAIRIEPRYGEYDLVPIVLYDDGSTAPGQTLVGNVRKSYPKRRR